MKNENGSEKRGRTQLPFSGPALLSPQPEHCPPPQAPVPGWGGWAEEGLKGAPEEVGTGGVSLPRPCLLSSEEPTPSGKLGEGGRVLCAWSLAFAGALSAPPTEQCLPSVKREFPPITS